jgi:hypothetical protein
MFGRYWKSDQIFVGRAAFQCKNKEVRAVLEESQIMVSPKKIQVLRSLCEGPLPNNPL